MSNYTLLNRVGNGEKKVICTPELWDKGFLRLEDIAPFLEQDALEIEELKRKGIYFKDMIKFMKIILKKGYEARTNEIVEGLRVWMQRPIQGIRRSCDNLECPFRKCRRKFTPNYDLFFNPSEYPYAEGKNELSHKRLRINRISIHLIEEHGLFEKGTGGWDQCYPSSAKQFAEDFYLPWLERKN